MVDEKNLKDVLAIVKHPQKGDADNGKTITSKILAKLGTSEGPVCIYHDATDMQTANTGYAGGNNVGLRAAEGDCLLLVNQDAVVKAGWLEALLAALARPQVGVAVETVEHHACFGPGRHLTAKGA